MVSKIFFIGFVWAFILYLGEAQYTPSSECISSFTNAMIQRHNELRALHGVDPLSEDRDIDQSAQEYAESITGLGYLVHSHTKGLGENLAYVMNSQYYDSEEYCAIVGREMTDNWYNEMYDPGYDFSNPGSQSGTGHFTQLIWKASTTIGVGLGISNQNEFYGVAQYSPQGNFHYVGQMAEYYEENVPQPLN